MTLHEEPEDLNDLLGGSGRILLRRRWKAQLVSLAVADDVFVGLQLLAPDCETGQGLPEQQNITKLKMRGVPGILVGGFDLGNIEFWMDCEVMRNFMTVVTMKMTITSSVRARHSSSSKVERNFAYSNFLLELLFWLPLWFTLFVSKFL